MKPLDIRDIAIIDAFPVHNCRKAILNVGCGEGRIDYHLAEMGYFVTATDISPSDSWPHYGCDNVLEELNFFSGADIFDLQSFPLPSFPIVICSQVLEHLKDWKGALKNLLALTEVRLIMTFPFGQSFSSPDHVNFWNDDDIMIFCYYCKPFSVSVSKIITKPKDIELRQHNYLIVVDKRQTDAT